MDTTKLPFYTLLLLERVQISWLPGWLPEREMAIALHANPVVAWYLRHKCPEVAYWLDHLSSLELDSLTPESISAAEKFILSDLNDLLVYVTDPSVYDAQPFLAWDESELTHLADFVGKTVIDIGAGTGRLALLAAKSASTVFAVEPVGNLRLYLQKKARDLGYPNVYVVDGLVTDIPFPNAFADITTVGHVFGDEPRRERLELERVTRPGGMVILCPGNDDLDNPAHAELVEAGYDWSRFEEPGDGWKRKYWKVISG